MARKRFNITFLVNFFLLIKMCLSHKTHNSTIKVKVGECSVCQNGKDVPLIKGMCKNHYWQSRGNKQEIKVTRKPIRKVSKKQAGKIRDYLKVRLVFMNDNPFCAVCGKSATDVHHRKGKIGELLTVARHFLAVCRSCHTQIEENPEWAKEQGYSLNRL